jgi:hypothetical protein
MQRFSKWPYDRRVIAPTGTPKMRSYLLKYFNISLASDLSSQKPVDMMGAGGFDMSSILLRQTVELVAPDSH